MGCSGGLVAEGDGVFAAIWAWLVGGMGYTPGCTVSTVSPVGSPSGTESSLMGLSTGFRLFGHFRGPIPSAWGFILGTGLLPWVDGQFCGHFHGQLVIIRDCVCERGLTWASGCICHGTVGQFLSHLKWGMHGQVDAANVAQGGRHVPALPWWAFARAGGEAEGDGGDETMVVTSDMGSMHNTPENTKIRRMTDCYLVCCFSHDVLYSSSVCVCLLLYILHFL